VLGILAPGPVQKLGQTLNLLPQGCISAAAASPNYHHLMDLDLISEFEQEEEEEEEEEQKTLLSVFACIECATQLIELTRKCWLCPVIEARYVCATQCQPAHRYLT